MKRALLPVVMGLGLIAAGAMLVADLGRTATGGPPPQPVTGCLPDVALADIAEGSVDSVVNISTTRVVRTDRRRGMPHNDPFFEWFFGPGGQERMPRERRAQSLGSGVIVSADGVVLTNNHVVEQAQDIRVTLYDGREIGAEVVGRDPQSDLAVLRLKGSPEDLRPIALGDSERLRLGETVLAIGNPFGLGHTVTQGIVSAKGRANMGIVDYEDFIQTDAAINPGNSGGALVNGCGELVGINSAIISRTGGYQGIGFAIPSNMARGIMNSLIEKGRVVRGWLGVMIQDVDDELATALKLPDTKGVLVGDVQPDSPAEEAGLKRGDVILAVDGKTVNSTGRLRNLIASKGVATKVELTLLRDGKRRLNLGVKLGELPSEYTASVPEPQEEGALAGLTVSALTQSLRQKFQIPERVDHGVVVTQVEPGSAAQYGGLRIGDVILEVNRAKVDSVGAFKKAYGRSPGKTVLLVVREGNSFFLVLEK